MFKSRYQTHKVLEENLSHYESSLPAIGILTLIKYLYQSSKRKSRHWQNIFDEEGNYDDLNLGFSLGVPIQSILGFHLRAWLQ